MMATKPKPESTASSSAVTNNATAASGGSRTPTAAAAVPAFAQPPPSSALGKTGGTNKNALLARITAAQERAKQAQQQKQPTPTIAITTNTLPMIAPVSQPLVPEVDLLSLDTNTTTTKAAAGHVNATPSFDDLFSNAPSPPAPLTAPASEPLVVAPTPPPVLLNDTLLPSTTTSQQQQAVLPSLAAYQWDPHAPHAPTAAAQQPSASSVSLIPSFEDLMVSPPTQAPMPPEAQQQQPPQQQEMEDDVMAAILAMEGLSTEEKEAMIEEQRKIMATIERNKQNAQVSAADAFEQRSLQAAVGAGRRIHATTATTTAGGVSGMTDAEREQMESDMKLAEMLQQEEYENAERQQQQQAAAAGIRSPQQQPSRSGQPRIAGAPVGQQQQQDQGWLEWLGLSSPSAGPTPASPAPRTAAEARRERERLIENSGAGGAAGSAAIASAPAPLFSCFTDSISQAATYALSATRSYDQDDEGNVNGVDSSGLLGGNQQSYYKPPE